MTPGQRVWCVVDVERASLESLDIAPQLQFANFVRRHGRWSYCRNLRTGEEWCSERECALTQLEAWGKYLDECALAVIAIGRAAANGEMSAQQLCKELAVRHVRMAYALEQQRRCVERELKRDGSERSE